MLKAVDLNLEVFSDGISNVGSERQNVDLNLEVFSDGISNVGSETENVDLNLEGGLKPRSVLRWNI